MTGSFDCLAYVSLGVFIGTSRCDAMFFLSMIGCTLELERRNVDDLDLELDLFFAPIFLLVTESKKCVACMVGFVLFTSWVLGPSCVPPIGVRPVHSRIRLPREASPRVVYPAVGENPTGFCPVR
jgi:hypothetical protein